MNSSAKKERHRDSPDKGNAGEENGLVGLQLNKLSNRIGIKSTESIYQIIAANTVDWEFWLNQEGHFIYCSPSCYRITGYSAHEFLRNERLLHDIIHPEDGLLYATHIHTGQNSYDNQDLIFRIIHRDGAVRWLGHVCKGVYSQSGEFLGYRGSNRDITNQVLFQRKLMESENKYRLLFENSHDAVFLVKADDGVILDCNKVASQLLEIEKSKIVGKQIWETAHRSLAEHYKGVFYRRISDIRTSVPEEGMILTINNKRKAYLLTDKLLTFQGEPVVMAILKDVTEEKKTAAALRTQNSILMAVNFAATKFLSSESWKSNIEKMLDLLARATETDRIYVCANPSEGEHKNLHSNCFEWQSEKRKSKKSEYDIICFSWRDSRGKNWEVIQPIPDREFLNKAGKKDRSAARLNPEKVRTKLMLPIYAGNEYWGFMALEIDGKLKKWSEIEINALEAATSILGKAIHKQIYEKEKKAMRKRLETAKRMESLGLLAGGVAHDLNNILGPLVAYPDLILEEIPEDCSCKEDLESMKNAALRASEIIQDLLTMSRRGRYEMKAVNINEVIEECLRLPRISEIFKQNGGIILKKKLNPDLPNIEGSQHHLTKVLLNVVINALEAMPDGGELRIATSLNASVQSKAVIVEIEDTGHGIDKHDLKHIFEPFYTKKKMGNSGSGLGLSVAYGVIKDHKGEIEVSSKPGQGTRFAIYLPASEIENQDIKAFDVSYCGSERIVLIDDDRNQINIAKKIIGKLGYELVAFSDWRDALEFIQHNDTELVILDMILDENCDGLDVYKQITELRPSLKALIVSGYAESSRVKEAGKLGVGGFVKKPYTLETIGRAIRAELERKV